MKLGYYEVQIRTTFCKNNLRTFDPQECQKYNIEPQQNLSAKCYVTHMVGWYGNICYGPLHMVSRLRKMACICVT